MELLIGDQLKLKFKSYINVLRFVYILSKLCFGVSRIVYSCQYW
jgi:hypothetical protein